MMWRSAMNTSYDIMMIEFTGDRASWTINRRSKHSSVARMVLRETPRSVRFMIIVTDPLNVSTQKVIKVSREVTEATLLSCVSQAPLEMVLMKPLKPKPKKKPLFGKTQDERAKVDKVEESNAEIAGDSAEGSESQIDDVAKIERDKTSEAKTDAVAENKNCEVPAECDSTANVERSTEAPQQRQPQQLCSDTNGAPDCESAKHVQQRIAEQVIDVRTSAHQRTVGQVVDAPTETVTVETVPAETEPLDRVPLGVTHCVERPERQDLLCWKARSHEPCGSSSNASDTSRPPSDASSALSDAVPSTNCPCAQGMGRTAGG